MNLEGAYIHYPTGGYDNEPYVLPQGTKIIKSNPFGKATAIAIVQDGGIQTTDGVPYSHVNDVFYRHGLDTFDAYRGIFGSHIEIKTPDGEQEALRHIIADQVEARKVAAQKKIEQQRLIAEHRAAGLLDNFSHKAQRQLLPTGIDPNIVLRCVKEGKRSFEDGAYIFGDNPTDDVMEVDSLARRMRVVVDKKGKITWVGYDARMATIAAPTLPTILDLQKKRAAMYARSYQPRR